MRPTLLLLLVAALPVLAGAAPRFFAPVFLKPGALNEVYAWDEAPVPAFTVEVRRAGQDKVLTTAHGFGVNRPLPVLGASNRPLKWSAALVAPDALAEPGPVTLRFVGPGGETLAEAASEVRARSFPVEQIPLDQAMTALRSQPNPRKDREAKEIWAVYQRFNPKTPWAGGRFVLPVVPGTPSSAHFGDTRQYLYADGTTSTDYHRGHDFAVVVGTSVSACAAGTVVLSAQRELTGTTVVVEHAPGLYSVYFHLSRSLVKPGQKVAAGQSIAFSGASGLVTGPHLHWEVRSEGTPVDPLDLVVGGLLDTKVVAAVISSSDRSIH